MKYCFTVCVPVFMRWCRYLFIQDLFLFLFQKRFLLAKKNYSEDGIPLSVVLFWRSIHSKYIRSRQRSCIGAELLPHSSASRIELNEQVIYPYSIQPYLIVASASRYLSFISSEVLFIMPPPPKCNVEGILFSTSPTNFQLW